MQNSTGPTLSLLPATLLWVARVLAIVILGFWGFFAVAHLVGDAGAASRPLTLKDYASISAMVASLLGLGLSFKWERWGSTVTLIAVAIGAALNWKVLMFPGTLIPVVAILFLWHSLLRNEQRRDPVAAAR